MHDVAPKNVESYQESVYKLEKQTEHLQNAGKAKKLFDYEQAKIDFRCSEYGESFENPYQKQTGIEFI